MEIKTCTSLSGREDLSWHEVRKRAGRVAQPKLSRKKRRLGKLSRKSGHRKQKWWGRFSWSPVARSHWWAKHRTYSGSLNFWPMSCLGTTNDVWFVEVLMTVSGWRLSKQRRWCWTTVASSRSRWPVNQDTARLQTLTNSSRTHVSHRQFACQCLIRKTGRNHQVEYLCFKSVGGGGGKLKSFSAAMCLVTL